MNNSSEFFLNDVIDICSNFFKQLRDTCEKYKNPSYHPDNSDIEEKKKAKKPKKKVVDPLKDDPEAPKKPIIQGYLLYYTEVRPQRQKEHPKLLNKDLTKLIADEWNKLPKDKKEAYEIKSRVNRQQYEKDLEEYFKKKPHMREVVNQSKNGGKTVQSVEGSVTNEPTPKIKPGKVLESSSDEDEDIKVKTSVVREEENELRAKSKKKLQISEDEDESDSDDSDDSERPIKKLKKK